MTYTMLKNAALLSVATVGGVLSALMGGWDALLKALLICMAVDYITGLAFAKDELGWWGDVLYRSTLDSNVWTPEQYPAGWEVVV